MSSVLPDRDEYSVKQQNRRAKRKGRPKQRRSIEFLIDNVDTQGQGVSKQGGQVTFISKVLPGETGVAEVYKTSKGVNFARLKELKSTSDTRQESDCPHYADCGACHYLHTDYETELQLKVQSLEQLCHRVGLESIAIDLIAAPQRLHYRNRVQLHYRHKYIGFIDPVDDVIKEVPHCKIISPELQTAFDRLYEKAWTENYQGKGHCELYVKEGEVSEQWNEDYAHGGFTQVNEAMNQKLKDKLVELSESWPSGDLLDLFSGAGNLSNALIVNCDYQRRMVDYTDHDDPAFKKMDLYSDDAFSRFKQWYKSKKLDVLMLDPPRKGFPDLEQWADFYRPSVIVYVSCKVQSLFRDIKPLLGKYRVDYLAMLDLFPGTHHFETLIVLRKTK